MATKLVNKLSLLELANRIAPNGDMATIVEVMSQENPILQDIPFIEANGGSVHKDTIRTFVPKGEKRQFDKGVGISGTKTEPITFNIAMYENYSRVDRDKCKIAPNPKQFRMDEAKGIIEGLSQTMAEAIFYGNSKIAPDESDGLAVICGKIDDRRVINAGGTGDNLTSIYIVQWDKVEAKGIYPRGSATGGIVHDDLGEDTVTDENGKLYQAYVDHFQCHMGLGITNPKRVARICNIPVDPAKGEKINLSKMIIRALNNMKQQGKGAVIYGNATAVNLLDIEALNKATVQLEDAFGMPVTQFRPGNPIRLCEAILDSEEQVA